MQSRTCSMPGASIAACGASTGRAPPPSSTTRRPSSRSYYAITVTPIQFTVGHRAALLPAFRNWVHR